MAGTGLILLTGATGYIGGRLIRPLEATGRPLRLMVREPERLRPTNPPASFVSRVAAATEIVRGDMFDPASLTAALADVDTSDGPLAVEVNDEEDGEEVRVYIG